MTPFTLPILTRPEIETLHHLRGVFLEEPIQGTKDYWAQEKTLHLYDVTFGRRIAWKWEAVCGELMRRGWRLPEGVIHLVDWGCGSGVATEIFLSQEGLGVAQIAGVGAMDRSNLAMQYTAKKALERFGKKVLPQPLSGDLSKTFFIVSHVLTELPKNTLDILLSNLAKSAGFLWIEPGSHLCSHRLANIREKLLSPFRIVAPCTQSQPCPLFQEGNERHWCHTFAQPPRQIFHTGEWARFAKEFGIDLRSLPVAFLAMDRSPAQPCDSSQSRVLGRPRHYKGHARLFTCGTQGLCESDLPFKTHKALLEEIEDAEFEALIPLP